jgi:predicted nucleotidyltransferase
MKEAQALILEIAQRLQDIDGVEAVALGGSRARGTHRSDSDIDIGIYYHPDHPLDLDALEFLANEIDDQHRTGLVTSLGGWGPWINGGGWLTVQRFPVDFLYRDLERVSDCIDSCCDGHVQIAYQPGHPHGFLTHIYLAEIALCQSLWDPKGTLFKLKARTVPYPPKLKQAIIERFHWEADFSLKVARKAINNRDVSYVAGCCFRCVSCLMQTLFALNCQYWMNEKGAVALASTFALCPVQLQSRIDNAFTQLETNTGLAHALEVLGQLVREAETLVSQRQILDG